MHYILLYNYTINDVFDNFPKTLQELSEPYKCFRMFSEIFADNRRLPNTKGQTWFQTVHYVIDINYQFQLFPRLEILVQNGRLDYKKTENIPEHKKNSPYSKTARPFGFREGEMNWPAFEYNINFEFFFIKTTLS